MKFVEPKTYLIGVTGIIEDQLIEYLKDSGNKEFLERTSRCVHLSVLSVA